MACHREWRSRIVRVLSVVVSAAALAAGSATAATLHVAAGNCSHASGAGSDSNDGLTRGTAFRTVARCFAAMGGGDTCTIHSGTYSGDFDCCGSPPAATLGTAANPTRILGAAGDSVTLNGSASQATPAQYGTGQATINMVNTTPGSGSKFFEIGNLTVNPGSGAAILFSESDDFYIHDIVVDDLSNWVDSSSEGRGLFDTNGSRGDTSRFLIEGITVSNGGTIRMFNVFSLAGSVFDGTVRMVDVADMDGGVNPGHHDANLNFEWIRVRNWRPWNDDDGGLRDGYNSLYTVQRYFDAEEGSGGANTVFGWLNSRSSENCVTKATNYLSNMYLEEDPVAGGNYGAFYHDHTWNTDCDPGSGVPANRRGLCSAGSNAGGWCDANGDCPGSSCDFGDIGIMDHRIFNVAAQEFTLGYLVNDEDETHPQSGMCDWHRNDFNAWIDVGTVIAGGQNCAGNYSMGASSATYTDAATAGVNADHTLQSGSGLRDTGNDETFGPDAVPWFPVPVGGGSRIDIGAHEFGAGSWPYDFQVVKSIARDPATDTVRICWATGQSGCDLTIPLWDPWAMDPDTRDSAPDHYWFEVDPANHFRSGNAGVAPGFGAFHSALGTAGANGSNRYHDIPAGTLDGAAAYYVRVRVGEQTALDDARGAGPGPWSVGFYRFDFGATSCGNGVIDGGEICDGADLGGQTCQDFGFTGGSLTCIACTIDTSACSGGTPPAVVENLTRTDTN